MLRTPIDTAPVAANAIDGPLRAEAVAALMAPEARRWFDLRVVETTASTNSDLLRDAASLPSGSVLVTGEQTAGRGRRGRVWIAPPGGSLAFSVLWKFAGNAAALSGLSLAVGIAVARVVERHGALGIGLKWPNDLVALRGGAWRKAGGMLIELTATDGAGSVGGATGGATGGTTVAVIGVGLNLDLGAAAGQIDQPVTDLRTLGCAASREALLAEILVQLSIVLPAFALAGFAPLAAEWNQRHAWQGMAVSLVQNDQQPGTAIGTARGVAEDGALLIDTAAGVQRVLSGDLSLRIASTLPAV